MRLSSTAFVALLFLAVALPTGAASDDADDGARHVLETCRRVAISAGVRFACEELAASVADYPDLSPDAALEVHVGGLKPLGKLSSAPADFSAGGQRWSAMRFSVQRADGSVAIDGRAAAVTIRKGKTRLVSCGAGSAARLSSCDPIMQLLATSGPAPYAVPNVAPSFLGRSIPVPKGCEVVSASDTQFRIKCGELAAVAFVRLQAPEHIERLSETMREQILKNVAGAADAEPRACRVGGEATRCKVVVAGSGANRTSFFIGGAQVKGVPVSVQCIQHAMVKGVHPVCASIIAF